MVGDENLEELVEKLLETYTLDEILEINDLTHQDVIQLLLGFGLINTEVPVVV